MMMSLIARGGVPLPLLEGLTHRPGVAEEAVTASLLRFHAGRLIVKWAEKQWAQKRNEKSRQQQAHPSVVDDSMICDDVPSSLSSSEPPKKRRKIMSSLCSELIEGHHYHHWLVQALLSRSLAERQVASRILCQGCLSPTAGPHRVWQAIELLVHLLERHVVSLPTVTPDASTIGLGWISLLKYLIFQRSNDGKLSPSLPAATASVSTPAAAAAQTSPSFLLAYTMNRRIGLTWVTSSIWKLSQQLNPRPVPLTTTTAIKNLIIALTDICYWLVLYGVETTSTPASTTSGSSNENNSINESDEGKIMSTENNMNKSISKGDVLKTNHRFLWTSPLPSPPSLNAKNNKISPLACLIGAHHVLKETYLQKGNNMDSCLKVLAQLVDPAAVPKVIKEEAMEPAATAPSNTNTTSNKSSTANNNNNNNNRLVTSFLRPPQSYRQALTSSSSSPDRNAMARIFSAVYGGSGDSKQHDDEDDAVMEDVDDDDDDDADDATEEHEDNEMAQVVEMNSNNNNDNSTHHDEEDIEKNDEDDEAAEDDEDEDEAEDEEIDSEIDEEEDCGGECDDDEEEVEDHDIVIHDDDVARFEEGLLELNEGDAAEVDADNENESTGKENSPKLLEERKKVYVRASMEVLAAQHPMLRNRAAKSLLSLPAEQAFLTSIMNIVKPPKKPVNTKIILRRAPTQEEFFRGSLSKNPVYLSMLKPQNSSASESQEPTVRDLRRHIAKDLQMEDSAELLELLVANKILDMNLKLRVVHQVLWKTHLMENSSSALSSFLSSGSAPSFFSTGSGLSMIFSTTRLTGERAGTTSGSRGITDETPLSSLPPMVVTYRLAGVDGEATEDTVNVLADPEAPSDAATPEEAERLLEKEFGITRLVMEGRGVFVVLRSVEKQLMDTLRRIRRDDVGLPKGGENPSRILFKKSPPSAGLNLLRCCSKLSSNRKLLLRARAPTVLLRLLLGVLHALEEGHSQMESGSNATATVLQEMIEVLASDISTVASTSDSVETDAEMEDASTLRLLLSSLETISLSRPLRNVIAKLLPYLTYGQSNLSRELASNFTTHVNVDSLGECEDKEGNDDSNMPTDWSVLMDTFVHTSVSLPPNDVCNSLRSELVNCGFIERIAKFLLRDVPLEPPPWSGALWSKDQSLMELKRNKLETEWRDYFLRSGLRTSFKMLNGLCKNHAPTQHYLASLKTSGGATFLQACHWMEATSDSNSARVYMKGLGLLAETLLDELSEQSDRKVSGAVKEIRRKTRNRKKEIAQERRTKALSNMGAFAGPDGTSTKEEQPSNGRDAVSSVSSSLWAPVLTLFQSATSTPQEKDEAAKPSWMAEMELMEDETGLTCAVCQEGRTLQPSELLGLYAYVKKVSVPANQCGGRSNIDGSALLVVLPPSLPDSLLDTGFVVDWYQTGKAAAEELKDSSRGSSLSSVASSRRATYFTTTVCAGNAIHFSCHTKARQADRSHPKAPKSEWEGASLRNSRVNCNVIVPLVSSRSSKVPLVAVDVALTDHQTAISNLLGARPKSMLWTVLHDVRFLLLRIAYGEALNADCGGGSLASNAQLVFYQLLMADMFEKDAQVDSPETAQHARSLSAGFLAACAIAKADEKAKGGSTNSLLRGIADSAPMAALTCIVFHNTKEENCASSESADDAPHPKRRWLIGKESFLLGLIKCAGRRHALGVENSGCITGRSIATNRNRSNAFVDWEVEADDSSPSDPLASARKSAKRSLKPAIDDFKDALRPMVIYFAIMDKLSSEFRPSMNDCEVEESANRMVQFIESCQRAKNIHELLCKAEVTLDHDVIIEELQKGMMSA